MGEDELDFYKIGTSTHSVSLSNKQLFLIKVKYKKKFSLSAWVQANLTEDAIKKHIKDEKE